MPRPVRTDPTTPRVSLRRSAVHHIQTSSIPRITRVPSVATSRRRPSHDGASATAPVTDRYADAEAPPVTSTAPTSPSPPGDTQVTTPAPKPRTANAPSSRPARTFIRGSRSMRPERRSGNSRDPEPNGNTRPRRSSGLTALDAFVPRHRTRTPVFNKPSFSEDRCVGVFVPPHGLQKALQKPGPFKNLRSPFSDMVRRHE